MREVIVHSVRAVGIAGEVVLVLKEKEGKRSFPIWIGLLEGHAISLALEKTPFPRPLTHDLFLIALGRLGATITSVSITGMALNTFFAKIEIVQEKNRMELDARPSDAIALALRAGAPIFASEELFQLGEEIPPAPPAPPQPVH